MVGLQRWTAVGNLHSSLHLTAAELGINKQRVFFTEGEETR